MLTDDVRFEGWTTESWSRFLHLWKPRASPDREATRARGCVIAVHEGGALRKLLHTHTGRLDPRIDWPTSLEALARTYHASWALSLHVGALEEVMERLGARMTREQDLTGQSLLLAAIVREMLDEGLIERWPKRLQGVPPPTEPVIHRTLDALCPDGHAVVLGMFRDGGLYTAFTARRRGHAFDVLAGPELVRELMGFVSGEWRRDYRHLARAVEELYAPVGVGIYAEIDRFLDLQVDSRPGAWGRAVAVRDLVISPVPPALGLAVGADSARYAFEKARKLTERFDVLGILEPALARARERFGDTATQKGIEDALGFDPLAALRALLRR